MNCCNQPMVGIEYDHTNKYRYDGVSEFYCETCGKRLCRWCEGELKEGEVAKVFCSGKGHPVLHDL